MKKYGWLLGLLAALFAGCGNNTPQTGPVEGVQQAEAVLQSEGQALLGEALSSFGDVLPASAQQLQPLAVSPRSMTLIRDSDGLTLVGGLIQPEEPISGMVNRPLFITIKEKSRPRILQAYLGILRQGNGGYEVEWYGQMENGRRLSSRSPLQVEQGAGDRPVPPPPPYPYASWKWKRIRIWDYTLDILLRRIHASTPFPTDLPGQPLSKTPDLSPIEDRLRSLYSKLPKPFDVDWPPPGLLKREHMVLAITPYRNPKLQNARSIEDILGEELALAYLRRTEDGRPLTEREKGKALSLRLIREGSGYTLVARDLITREEISFRVSEVSWCDGCWFPGMPTEIRLGIEDKLGDPPHLFYLQINNLLLGGIAP